MKISLIQNDIIWEHKSANLMYYDSLFSGLSGKTDIVVLPEMCTTGFSLKTAELAEYDNGETIKAFSNMAANYGFAIAGSFIGYGSEEKEAKFCYNRGFFIQPDGKKDFYNKKHLYRMGEENEFYTPGNEKTIIKYKGWNIRLIICYDLRFPVWTRNVNNEYDLLIVSANWPEPRRNIWNTLLPARAIENMAYVCGVNRVGTDGMKLHYTGDSKLINAHGTVISTIESEMEQVQTVDIDLESLKLFREKFPVWKDADQFVIK
jgi:omega-amidase